MSIWDNIGDDQISDSFDMGGGEIAPIPSNTNVAAIIDEAKWDSRDGVDYISLRWSVLAPADYKNRKVWQKLQVRDEKKAQKHARMLAHIDHIAGAKLMERDVDPTDQDLQALCNRPMQIKVMVWEIDDKKGNWVCAVSKNGPKPMPTAAPSAAPAEDVPF